MTNVFPFTSKKNALKESDFLKENDDTLVFVKNDQNTTIEALKAPPPSPKDWSNQELASIYRVKRLLDAAGVPNTLERGITDECDPWCIFCTPMGEVFIHLCRIDHRYILDSPNLKSPLVGMDFGDLIAQFSHGALQHNAQTVKASNRLIKLPRNGKVFLHPPVMLAALIWSIYINSEEIVLLAQETSDADVDTALTLLDELDTTPLSPEALQEMHAGNFVDRTFDPDTALARMSDEVREAGMLKEGTGKMGLMYVPNSIAVGLSSIAIAFGIFQEILFDDDIEIVGTNTEQSIIPENEGTLDVTQEKTESDTRTVEFDLGVILQAALDIIPEYLDQPEHLLQAIFADGLTYPASSPDMAVALFNATTLSPPKINMGSKEISTEIEAVAASERDAPEEAESDEIAEEEQTETHTLATIGDLLPTAPIQTVEPTQGIITFASLIDIKNSQYGPLQTISFGEQTFETTFDVSEISEETTILLASTLDMGNRNDPVQNDDENTELAAIETLLDGAGSESDDLLGGQATDTLITPVPGNHGAFDSAAQAFVRFLLDQSDDIEMLYGDGDLVIFDAGSEPEMGNSYYVKTWVTENGQTISTVGLKSYFEAFDLVA